MLLTLEKETSFPILSNMRDMKIVSKIKQKNHMIILGEKHSFSQLELDRLKKNFSSIEFIKYNNVEIEKVIDETKRKLNNSKTKLIVLNTQALVPHELLIFLTQQEQRGISYISLKSFMENFLQKIYISQKFTNDIDFLENIKPYKTYQYFFKYIIDYSFSLSILLVTSPIILYAIYKIKKESPGPILFKQERTGINGKSFMCIKFRSMDIDAEKNGAQFATKDDNRIYKWGNTMRKLRIDELPQLWNVLKGEMHLIGPRPERPVWIEQFKETIPYYDTRHTIKPGLTGWAQVNYPYGENEYDAYQKLMYDLYYIKNWSLWLEFKTVVKTVLVVLGRKGL